MSVHLLTSWKFLPELQTSIHILLAQCHSSLALSTGPKMRERPFCVLVSKSGMRYLMNTKTCQRNPSKEETKRALLNILETEDSYMEPDEITMLKFKHSKIEPNWISSTICFVHLKTMTFSPLQLNICQLPFFFFLVYLFVFLCSISSFPFQVISSVIKIS